MLSRLNDGRGTEDLLAILTLPNCAHIFRLATPTLTQICLPEEENIRCRSSMLSLLQMSLPASPLLLPSDYGCYGIGRQASAVNFDTVRRINVIFPLAERSTYGLQKELVGLNGQHRLTTCCQTCVGVVAQYENK